MSAVSRRAWVTGALVLPAVAGCRKPAASRAPGAVVESAPEDVERFAALRGATDDILPPDAAELAEQRARVQGALQAEGLAALVVEAGAGLRYLTGAPWGASERPFLLVLPARGDPRIVCPHFELGTASERVGDLELVGWREHDDPYAIAADLVPAGPVAIDPAARVFVADGLTRALGRAFVASDALRSVRAQKTPRELDRLRRANEVTLRALALVAAHATHVGQRQSALAQEVRTALGVAALSDVWVLALVGSAAAFPHGTAHDAEITEGDLVLVDTGGSLHGYRSDITRTWAIGDPSPPQHAAWEAVADAQQAALASLRAGAIAGDIDASARAEIERAGFGREFTHRLGHGIGLETHESPYLVRGSTAVLRVRETMSVEPGIYVPGSFGVRLEDIVAITETGVEVFGTPARSLDDPFAT